MAESICGILNEDSMLLMKSVFVTWEDPVIRLMF